MLTRQISEIYAANDDVRGRLKEFLSGLAADEANARPGDAKWSIAEIAEHVAIVEYGTYRICAKLLGKAQADNAVVERPGHATLSTDFAAAAGEVRDAKLEAPDIVKPTGKMSVADAIAKMDDTAQKLDEIRPLFDTLDCDGYKFPHPYFGEMSAAEWLSLIGGHAERHLKQAETVLAEIRK
ncbi:MAG: DinB family protein [Pyrinomonadaceae bacterium]